MIGKEPITDAATHAVPMPVSHQRQLSFNRLDPDYVEKNLADIRTKTLYISVIKSCTIPTRRA